MAADDAAHAGAVAVDDLDVALEEPVAARERYRRAVRRPRGLLVIEAGILEQQALP